jgi:hypothetical protein
MIININAVHKINYIYVDLPDESESDVIDLHVCIFGSGIHIPSAEHTAVIASLQLSSSCEPWRVEL